MSELSVEPLVWLTQTKLIPPRLRDDYLPRPRLLALLAQVIPAHSLTLVSALAPSDPAILSSHLYRRGRVSGLPWN